MATRSQILAETLRRLGSYREVTVSLDADVSDLTAQRKIVSSDLYDIDRTAPSMNDVYCWVGRYNDGRKIRRQSFAPINKTVLTQPNANYTLKIYGYGTTGTINHATATSSDIQTAIRAVSTGLSAATVGGTGPFTITLPSSTTTIELVTAGTGGSISQGMASVEVNRPFSNGLPVGTQVVLSTKVPIEDDNGVVGVNSLINQALERLWFIDLLHFTSSNTNSDQLSYEISSLYPWIKTRSQIIRAYSPVEWTYTGAYTVPVTSHTLSIDLGLGAVATTGTLAGSATATVIQTALATLLSTNSVQGTVTVDSNSTTRTITITNTLFADIAVTVSTAASVTETHTQTGDRRWIDGWRLRFNGEQLEIEWDQSFNRGQTWYLEVYRPGHTWICPQIDYQTEGTTYQSAESGFTNDLDQTPIDTLEVAAVTHYLACRQLAQQGPSQETRFWRTEAGRAAAIAAWSKSLDLPSSREPGHKDDGLTANRQDFGKGLFSTGWS